MTQLAKQLHAKVEAAIPANLFLPSILAMNSLLLFGLDWQQGIARWIKLAATLFLSF